VVAAATVSVLAVGFVGGRAWAGGIPTKGALTYSGLLQDVAGKPLTGTGHNMEIKLWSTGPAGGTQLCDTTGLAPDFKLDASGRFSLQLDDTCTGAIGANAGAFVEVILDGSPLGPRTKLGAVPYAIEANHAVSADNATNANVAATANAAAGALKTTIDGLAANALTVNKFGSSALVGAPVPTGAVFKYAAGTAVFSLDASGSGTVTFPSPFLLEFKPSWLVGGTPTRHVMGCPSSSAPSH